MNEFLTACIMQHEGFAYFLTGFKEKRFLEKTGKAGGTLLTRLKSVPSELPSDHIRKHPVTRRQFLALASIKYEMVFFSRLKLVMMTS